MRNVECGIWNEEREVWNRKMKLKDEKIRTKDKSISIEWSTRNLCFVFFMDLR